MKVDVDNKVDKEYVDDVIVKEEERVNNVYVIKEYIYFELVDKIYVDNKMLSEVIRVENEYFKKIYIYFIFEIIDLNVSFEKKVDKEYVVSKLEKKVDKEYVDEKDNEIKERVDWYYEWILKILKIKVDIGWVLGCLDFKVDKIYVNDELEKKVDKNYIYISFIIVVIESIEGMVEEIGGDVLYCKFFNFL